SFTVGAAGLAAAPLTPPVSTVRSLDHVFMVYLENKGYNDVVGSPNAPYLNSLINAYGVETNYFALAHPSDSNYYPILGGSDFGFNYNCATNCFDEPNLADEIEAAHENWRGYEQSMPFPGDSVASGDYDPAELPFFAFSNIYNDPARAAQHLFPLTQMATDLESAATTPNFVWFAANEANNGEGPISFPFGLLQFVLTQFTDHQYNVPAADAFLQQNVSTILNSPVWNDLTQKSAIFVTFDEDNNNLSLGFGNEGNHVVTVVIPSPGAVAAGMRSGHFTVSDYANHYSLQRTIEDSLGLPPLTDNDEFATPMNGFWT
ncbi:MAG TPA: alkaline phosphatase family protein, partial [Mycobacterium sp.]|nr:alkaline phosphatase family protein [Mycobacterium sp.]